MINPDKPIEPRVSTKLLKDLVNALDKALDEADRVKQAAEASSYALVSNYTIEMSKAAGLASGVMQEGALLIQDIQTMIANMQNGKLPAKSSTVGLSDLLKSVKGGGFN